MEKKTRRRYDAQRRALNVVAENRTPVEASTGGTKAVADLTSVVGDVTRLSTEHSEQLIVMRKAFKVCRELRRTLYGMLKAAVRISASVVLEKESAEIMQLPRTGNDGKFVDDGRAIRNVLAKYRQAFIDAGLAARVFVDLPKQLDEFVAAKDRGRTARERIGLVLGEITERLNAGDQAIDVIEAILATSAEADPGAVKHLRVAKRVGPSKAGTPAETPAAATADPTAQTAAS